MIFEIIISIFMLLVIAAIVVLIVLYSKGDIPSGPTGPTGLTGPIGTPGEASMTGATGPRGMDGKNTTLITLNPGGFYQNTAFIFFGSQTNDFNEASIVISKPSIISDFFIRNTASVSDNPGIIRRYDLLVNNTATAITTRMTGSQTIATNNNTVNVQPGDFVTVLYSTIGVPLQAKGAITFSITSLS
jgi:hypothetical protein